MKVPHSLYTCDYRIHSPMLVVGTDDPGSMHMMASGLQIFEYNDTSRKWNKLQNILGIVHDPVHDVAFAPNPGRCAKQICGWSLLSTCVFAGLTTCLRWHHVMYM